jgi:hypothetical protein
MQTTDFINCVEGVDGVLPPGHPFNSIEPQSIMSTVRSHISSTVAKHMPFEQLDTGASVADAVRRIGMLTVDTQPWSRAAMSHGLSIDNFHGNRISPKGMVVPTVNMYREWEAGDFAGRHVTLECYAALASSCEGTKSNCPGFDVMNHSTMTACVNFSQLPMIAGVLDRDTRDRYLKAGGDGDEAMLVPMGPEHFINYVQLIQRWVMALKVSLYVDYVVLNAFLQAQWGAYGHFLKISRNSTVYDGLRVSIPEVNLKALVNICGVRVKNDMHIESIVGNLVKGVKMPMLIDNEIKNAIEMQFEGCAYKKINYLANGLFEASFLDPNARTVVVSRIAADYIDRFTAENEKTVHDVQLAEIAMLVAEQDLNHKVIDVYSSKRARSAPSAPVMKEFKAWRVFNNFISSYMKTVVNDGRFDLPSGLGGQNTHLKLVELSHFGLIPRPRLIDKMKSHADLCSGDGGFVMAAKALNYSLPIFAMDSDGRLRSTLKQLVASNDVRLIPDCLFDITAPMSLALGAIMELDYVEKTNLPRVRDAVALFSCKVVEFVGRNFKRKFDLVTADGFVPVTSSKNHSYLPKDVMSSQMLLFYWQLFVGASIIEKGGTLVIKYCFHFSPIQAYVVGLFAEYFKFLSVAKPPSSSVTNNERYLVLGDFKGCTYCPEFTRKCHETYLHRVYPPSSRDQIRCLTVSPVGAGNEYCFIDGGAKYVIQGMGSTLLGNVVVNVAVDALYAAAAKAATKPSIHIWLYKFVHDFDIELRTRRGLSFFNLRNVYGDYLDTENISSISKFHL